MKRHPIHFVKLLSFKFDKDSTRKAIIDQRCLRIRMLEFPLWLSRLRPDIVSVSTQVRSLASLNGLRLWSCRKVPRRSQIGLGSVVAVV